MAKKKRLDEQEFENLNTKVYVIPNKRREISFMDYFKMGFGLYLGYTFAEKYVPVVIEKIKRK